MPDTVHLPLYALPPGSGPTPRGVYHDPATSFKMAKTLLKAARPHMTKGKGKRGGKVRNLSRPSKPATATKK